MTPLDAAKLLDIAPDATPEQVEARFLELRAKLEDKIAKAPTPGLKEKYRATLTDITTAFETLTLAADSSSLPVLSREQAGDRKSGPTDRPQQVAGTKSSAPGKPGGKEFVFVAAIALAVLAAGGWWVVNSRKESAEKERQEAVAKGEAERQAMLEKQKLETDRLASEAAARADRERLDALNASLRARFAEAKIKWDSLEREGASAERRLSELRSDARSLRDPAPGEQAALAALITAQQGYTEWLLAWLSAHPAKALIARIDALIGARSFDDAATAFNTLDGLLTKAPTELTSVKAERLTLTGALRITTEPSGIGFTVRDGYGRSLRGQTPAEFTDIPFGSATVTFQRPGWPERSESAQVTRTGETVVAADLNGGSLEIASTPFPASFLLRGQGRTDQGRTPATLADLPPGNYTAVLSRVGWSDIELPLSVKRLEKTSVNAAFPAPGSLKIDSSPTGASVSIKGQSVGTTPLVLNDYPPGTHTLEFTLTGYLPNTTTGALAPGSALALNVSLEKKIPTQQEAFEAFWKNAAGYWKTTTGGLTGNVDHFLMINAGSTTINWKMKFLGGSEMNYNMIGYDAENDAIIVANQGGFLQPVMKSKMYFRDGALHWGTAELARTQKYNRISAGEW